MSRMLHFNYLSIGHFVCDVYAQQTPWHRWPISLCSTVAALLLPVLGNNAARALQRPRHPHGLSSSAQLIDKRRKLVSHRRRRRRQHCHHHYRSSSRPLGAYHCVCSAFLCVDKSGKRKAPCSMYLTAELRSESALTFCGFSRRCNDAGTLASRHKANIVPLRLSAPTGAASRWDSTRKPRRDVTADYFLNVLAFFGRASQPFCCLHASGRSATCASSPHFGNSLLLHCCFLCTRAGFLQRCKPQMSLLSRASRRLPTQPMSQSPESRYSSRVSRVDLGESGISRQQSQQLLKWAVGSRWRWKE